MSTNFDPISYLWSGALTLFTGGFLYNKSKEDRRLDEELRNLWSKKVGIDVMEMVLAELRSSREERRHDFETLNSRLDDLIHRSHSARKEDP